MHQSMKKLLVTLPWNKEDVSRLDDYMRQLEECGFQIHFYPDQSISEDALIENLQNVAVLIYGTGKLSARVLEAAKDLKMIAKLGVGLESIDIPAATARGIPVVNDPVTASEPVAEFTCALMLAAARRLPENIELGRSGRWGRTIGRSLYRQTLGIVGFGNIGQTLAKIVRGFDMKVVAYDHRHTPLKMEAAQRLDVEFVPFDTLIEKSDFVSLHIPQVPANENLMNEVVLKKMKSTAILINTSRGAMVDEDALYAALKNGTIGGAALDVHKKEPFDTASPLLTLRNCILTTHNGVATREARNQLIEICVRNILTIMDGKKPVGLVNPEVFEGRNISL
jgi:phosphoglycerate dehydrogenase-like enzyme